MKPPPYFWTPRNFKGWRSQAFCSGNPLSWPKSLEKSRHCLSTSWGSDWLRVRSRDNGLISPKPTSQRGFDKFWSRRLEKLKPRQLMTAESVDWHSLQGSIWALRCTYYCTRLPHRAVSVAEEQPFPQQTTHEWFISSGSQTWDSAPSLKDKDWFLCNS